MRRGSAPANDTLTFSERISIRSNTLDWLFIRPNIGIEFDLLPYDYGKWTIGIDALYNWKTHEKLPSKYVYDIAQLTLEGKRYFRAKRRNGLSWHTYYVGMYAAAADYSIKLSETGRQGQMLGAGASVGYGFPIAKVGSNYIDLEFGARLGAALSHNDAYTMGDEDGCYVAVPEKDKSWHLVPYPVLHDLHISLVYRFHSIRTKYEKPNYKLEEELAARQQELEWKRDSIREARIEREKEMRQQLDEIRRQKAELKAARKAEKKAAKDAINALRNKYGRKDIRKESPEEGRKENAE